MSKVHTSQPRISFSVQTNCPTCQKLFLQLNQHILTHTGNLQTFIKCICGKLQPIITKQQQQPPRPSQQRGRFQQGWNTPRRAGPRGSTPNTASRGRRAGTNVYRQRFPGPRSARTPQPVPRMTAAASNFHPQAVQNRALNPSMVRLQTAQHRTVNPSNVRMQAVQNRAVTAANVRLPGTQNRALNPSAVRLQAAQHRAVNPSNIRMRAAAPANVRLQNVQNRAGAHSIAFKSGLQGNPPQNVIAGTTLSSPSIALSSNNRVQQNVGINSNPMLPSRSTAQGASTVTVQSAVKIKTEQHSLHHASTSQSSVIPASSACPVTQECQQTTAFSTPHIQTPPVTLPGMTIQANHTNGSPLNTSFAQMVSTQSTLQGNVTSSTTLMSPSSLHGHSLTAAMQEVFTTQSGKNGPILSSNFTIGMHTPNQGHLQAGKTSEISLELPYQLKSEVTDMVQCGEEDKSHSNEGEISDNDAVRTNENSGIRQGPLAKKKQLPIDQSHQEETPPLKKKCEDPCESENLKSSQMDETFFTQEANVLENSNGHVTLKISKKYLKSPVSKVQTDDMFKPKGMEILPQSGAETVPGSQFSQELLAKDRGEKDPSKEVHASATEGIEENNMLDSNPISGGDSSKEHETNGDSNNRAFLEHEDSLLTNKLPQKLGTLCVVLVDCQSKLKNFDGKVSSLGIDVESNEKDTPIANSLASSEVVKKENRDLRAEKRKPEFDIRNTPSTSKATDREKRQGSRRMMYSGDSDFYGPGVVEEYVHDDWTSSNESEGNDSDWEMDKKTAPKSKTKVKIKKIKPSRARRKKLGLCGFQSLNSPSNSDENESSAAPVQENTSLSLRLYRCGVCSHVCKSHEDLEAHLQIHPTMELSVDRTMDHMEMPTQGKDEDVTPEQNCTQEKESTVSQENQHGQNRITLSVQCEKGDLPSEPNVEEMRSESDTEESRSVDVKKAGEQKEDLERDIPKIEDWTQDMPETHTQFQDEESNQQMTDSNTPSVEYDQNVDIGIQPANLNGQKSDSYQKSESNPQTYAQTFDSQSQSMSAHLQASNLTTETSSSPLNTTSMLSDTFSIQANALNLPSGTSDPQVNASSLVSETSSSQPQTPIMLSNTSSPQPPSPNMLPETLSPRSNVPSLLSDITNPQPNVPSAMSQPHNSSIMSETSLELNIPSVLSDASSSQPHTPSILSNTSRLQQHVHSLLPDTSSPQSHTSSVLSDTSSPQPYTPGVLSETSRFKPHAPSLMQDTSSPHSHTSSVLSDTSNLRPHTPPLSNTSSSNPNMSSLLSDLPSSPPQDPSLLHNATSSKPVASSPSPYAANASHFHAHSLQTDASGIQPLPPSSPPNPLSALQHASKIQSENQSAASFLQKLLSDNTSSESHVSNQPSSGANSDWPMSCLQSESVNKKPNIANLQINKPGVQSFGSSPQPDVCNPQSHDSTLLPSPLKSQSGLPSVQTFVTNSHSHPHGIQPFIPRSLPFEHSLASLSPGSQQYGHFGHGAQPFYQGLPSYLNNTPPFVPSTQPLASSSLPYIPDNLPHGGHSYAHPYPTSVEHFESGLGYNQNQRPRSIGEHPNIQQKSQGKQSPYQSPKGF